MSRARDAREAKSIAWDQVPLRTHTAWRHLGQDTVGCEQPVGDLILQVCGDNEELHTSQASCQGRCYHLQALVGMETKAAGNTFQPYSYLRALLLDGQTVEQKKHFVAHPE